VTGPDPLAAYFAAVHAADEALGVALGRVRADQDAGLITAVEAAFARVDALERHLAECRRLRSEMGSGEER
jgi:hypothetical protein